LTAKYTSELSTKMREGQPMMAGTSNNDTASMNM